MASLTKNMRQILLAVIPFLIGLSAYANGDPVAKFSSINRVANPEPLSISEICIIHEQIHITHVDGYNCFDVIYRFKNESDKDFSEIHYGFPIDYLVADEQETYRFTGDYYTESISEIGWNEKLIKDIAFTFNGDILPFHSSKESVREAGFVVEIYDGYRDSIPVEAVNRRWFYTKFAMGSNAEAILNVRYKVYANSFVGLYSDDDSFSYYGRKTENANEFFNNLPFIYRYFADRFDILYDFTPAKHFGNGDPYVIDVDIDLSNLANPRIRGEDGSVYEANHIKRNIYVVAQNIKPIALTVDFQSDHSEKNIRRMIDRFKIPKTEFDVAMEADTVLIDFHSPMFLSEVAFDTDTTKVNTINSLITYADGSQKRYRFESRNISSYSRYDTRIKSPVLLTITDLYQDGIVWSENGIDFLSQDTDFDNSRFKIKNIKLIFDTGVSAMSVCKNIEVLDARFINNDK